jgi:carbonic anhydrase/acetyltransferase-like protein (isoleucine patch superfamily)
VSHEAAQLNPASLAPGSLIPFGGSAPSLGAEAWVAPGATLIGAVRLGRRASVWYGTVLRADGDRIEIGDDSNVQDGCVAHADPGRPVVLGAGVSVGHRAVLHGCTVDDDTLIGMGAVLLNGSRVGAGSIVAAGTVLLEETVIPPGSLVAGVPGRVRRRLTEDEKESIRDNARIYLTLSRRHAEAARPVATV